MRRTPELHFSVATYNVHKCIGRDGAQDPERVAKVILSACQACGICVAECPAEAIQMRNLKNESIYLGIKCLGV